LETSLLLSRARRREVGEPLTSYLITCAPDRYRPTYIIPARAERRINLRLTMLYRICVAVVLAFQAITNLAAEPTPGSSPAPEKEATPATAPGIFYDSSKTNAWAIKGKVIFSVPEGIFVRCERNLEPGQRRPKEGEIVFIRDPFPDLATFKNLKIGSEVRRDGFSIGMLPNKIGHKIPAEVHGFELR
ncbi:MAG: hypothetical protein M3Y69_10280, partial [Verrucomicrobiota bacterium]|nr:hypothetical protein [Verrucomicrobiota bacterium]